MGYDRFTNKGEVMGRAIDMENKLEYHEEMIQKLQYRIDELDKILKDILEATKEGSKKAAKKPTKKKEVKSEEKANKEGNRDGDEQSDNGHRDAKNEDE